MSDAAPASAAQSAAQSSARSTERSAGYASGRSSAGSARASARPHAEPSLLASLAELWHALPGLVNDRVELLSLELQRAGAALAKIVVFIVAAAILGVTAWLVLWGAVVMALVGAGLALGWALLLALLLNLGAAAWALLRARRLLPLLRLPATRRHLMIGTPAPAPEDEDTAP